MSLFFSQSEDITHELVRIYYHKIRGDLNEPEKREKKLIGIDRKTRKNR